MKPSPSRVWILSQMLYMNQWLLVVHNINIYYEDINAVHYKDLTKPLVTNSALVIIATYDDYEY